MGEYPYPYLPSSCKRCNENPLSGHNSSGLCNRCTRIATHEEKIVAKSMRKEDVNPHFPAYVQQSPRSPGVSNGIRRNPRQSLS